jgi:hypothetical protein
MKLWWMFVCSLLASCVADSKPVGDLTATDASTDAATQSSSGAATTGDDAVCGGDFATSVNAWENLLMQQQGRSYSYTRVETVETGEQGCDPAPDYICDVRTTFTVEGGTVTSRELVATPRDGAPMETCPDGYSESGDSIGSHDGGAPPLTLDALYQGCCEVAMMSGGFGPGFGQASFAVDDIGVLASCSDLLCDDCGCFSSTNYTIEDLAFAM